MNSLLRIFCLIILLTSSFQNEEDCKLPYVSCFGLCVESAALCPIEITCQNGFVKTNLYTCSKSIDFAVPSKCNQNEECWDGTCQIDRGLKCPTMMTCPPSINIRCPDNSCVNSIGDCPNIVECPSFLPIRCPTGDCRNRLEDCPSTIRCPPTFSIQCNDGSCRMLPDDCQVPTIQSQCIDQSMVRCPDGTCKSAKFLCTSSITCPNGLMKCWNGKCTDNICEDPPSKQSSFCDKNMINCPLDYSCKNDISLCPTGVICPVDKPVKCWDMSCKETISKCPKYQNCPVGLINCADGSCTKDKCGTHITCSIDAPFKCFDNTCRGNPADCADQSNCPSDSPILCWDGRCVLERGECLSPDACKIDQVKCPDNLCKNSFEECKVTMECPNGFSRCSNGMCRKRLSDCEEPECPLNFPNKCTNGMCVSNLKNCDKENGCPYNKPVKCKYGECVENQNSCSNDDSNKCKLFKLCPDGSCVQKEIICPEANGCPIDSPLLCGDGSCIPKKGICPIPICSSEKPVRCLNGACVLTISNCPKTERVLSSDKVVICADGTEKPYFEECKPLITCLNNQVRCNDGSCRDSLELCPLAKTCPNNQIRCSNGSCALSLEECLNNYGCPNNKNYKCSQSGLCVKNAGDCLIYQKQFGLANGCDQARPLKCSSGKCVSSLSDCEESYCEDPTPVLCMNGLCVSSARECRNQSLDCIDNYVECPNGQCRPSLNDCLIYNNCPIINPFRCSNGECKRYPLKHNQDDSNGCDVGIRCPDHKPFLCADGSCAEKSTFCFTFLKCPEDKPYSCFDRVCVESFSDCSKDVFKCPAKNSILCSNGNCVSSFSDCYEMICPSWKPYLCVDGKCSTKPSECVLDSVSRQKTSCQNEEVMCHDGSCRKSFDRCPLYLGCTGFSSPNKCQDGSCVKPNEICKDETKIECNQDKILCEDGICRKKCPDYNGCPNSTPFMCSTGICVKTILECVAESNCPNIDIPFRCSDGSCVPFITDCKLNLKNVATSNIILSVFPEFDLSADIVVSESNTILGSIFIASDSLEMDESIASTTVNITNIPRNRVQNTHIQYNITRKDDILKVFPFTNSADKLQLENEYSVLSSIISITFIQPDIKFRNYLLLTLVYSFPLFHEAQTNLNKKTSSEKYFSLPIYQPLNHLRDVCLGKLDETTNEWKCVNLQQKTENLFNLQLQGAVNSEGIYAVILNPLPNATILHLKANFFIDNFVPIIIAIFVLIILLGGGIYTFARIIRYRAKYKESRRKFTETEKEVDLMKTISSNKIGQNLGDTKEGVIFTENPAFKETKEEKVNKRQKQLESMINSYMKRQKILDKNNLKLQTTYDNLKTEYERLIKYKESLNNPQDSSEINFINKKDN